MSSDSTPGLVERFYKELWNAWDDAVVEGVLADDFVFRGSLGDETRGRDGWRAYRDMIRLVSPDFHNELVDLVCDGDRAAVHVVCTGHQTGTLFGLPPSGRAFRYDVAGFFNAGGGLLRTAWVLGDLDALKAQLIG